MTPTVTLVLVGPTAVGKSRLAVALAQQLAAAGRPAEVVSADSMLVYRGMDIGTAKPTLAERGGVRHHLIDIMEVQETATVAEFQRLARAAIADCRERGVVPVVVGGSALYIRAIVDDFEFPGTDPAVRDRLEARTVDDRAGTAVRPAGRRWTRLAPPRYSRRTAGGSSGRWRSTRSPGESFTADLAAAPLRAAGRGADRTGHRPAPAGPADRRPGRRDVDRRAGGGGPAPRRPRTAGRAHRLPRPGVPAGADLPGRRDHRGGGAYAETVTATRRFARRQDSWFRRDPRIHWLDHDRPDLVHQAGESRSADRARVPD